MGVYRSIVESEEVVHLDDENNVDLKEIDKIVADHDANADEQERAQDAEYADPGTEDSVEDIMDEFAIAIYEFESENAKIMRAIGLHELNESVAGRDFIFEADEDKEAFFSRVITALKTFFTKIYDTLKKWYRKIEDMLDYNAKLWDKKQKQISDGYEICVKSDKKVPNLYPFDNLPDSSVINSNFESAKSDSNDFEKDSVKWTEDGCEEILNKIKVMFIGREFKESESLSEALRNQYCGKKKQYWMSVDSVKDALKNHLKDKRAVNDLVRKSADSFKAHINNINKMKKEAKSGEKDKEFMAACTRACNTIKSIANITETFRVAYCGCLFTYVSQARKVASMYIAAAGKKKEESTPAPKAESTEFGFLGKFL